MQSLASLSFRSSAVFLTRRVVLFNTIIIAVWIHFAHQLSTKMWKQDPDDDGDNDRKMAAVEELRAPSLCSKYNTENSHMPIMVAPHSPIAQNLKLGYSRARLGRGC